MYDSHVTWYRRGRAEVALTIYDLANLIFFERRNFTKERIELKWIQIWQ